MNMHVLPSSSTSVSEIQIIFNIFVTKYATPFFLFFLHFGSFKFSSSWRNIYKFE